MKTITIKLEKCRNPGGSDLKWEDIGILEGVKPTVEDVAARISDICNECGVINPEIVARLLLKLGKSRVESDDLSYRMTIA